MNKWKTAFFTLSLVLFILSTTAFAGSLSIPNMSGEKGDVVEIPIDVNNAVSMAGFQITVNYDPAVLDCTRAVPSELTKGWGVTANPPEGQVKIGGFDPTLSGPSGRGTIVKLVCTVIGDSQK